MKNYKTTVFGALAALGTFVAQGSTGLTQVIATAATGIFTFLMGASAKDHNVQ